MRKIKKIDCVSCGKETLEKNEIGINKKLLGEQIDSFYCMDCLAEYLGVSVQDILDKIEEFKDQGCKLFD
jgi:biotin operon repressor